MIGSRGDRLFFESQPRPRMRFITNHLSTSHSFISPHAALVLGLLFVVCSSSFASTKKTRRHLTSAEAKQATARLSEMGYGSDRTALIAFQKYEGRKATGQLTRSDFEAIMNASAPEARDAGYRHVE